jgi:hypothetical protein
MKKISHKFKSLAVLCAAFLGLGFGALTPAQAAGWTPNQDDALLFEVRLGQYRLGDGARGYQTPDGVCVDMADMIMALDIPVRLDKKLRRATGWAFSENRTMLIDREANTVQIMNKSEQLGDTIHDAPEGWCVDTKKLGDWLGVTLEADTTNALLIIRSTSKLPVEMAQERKARASKIRPVSSFDLKSMPNSTTPYKGFRIPSVDVVVAAGGLREKHGQSRTDLTYEAYVAGEVGPVAYDARLASNHNGIPDSLRIRAYRSDPEGKLLGSFKATQVAAGDVTGFSTPLVSQASIGRGAMLTNRPLERPDNFDRTTFRGELPSGWDAELYRNGQLLGFAVNRSDGRYEFADVPLLYGQNRFEIVLYGPQGQIRREERSVPVGVDSIPPKQTWYWAGINQDGRDLIGIGRGPIYGTGGWRGSLGLERGLNLKTSVALALHSLEVREVGRRNFAEASIRRAIGPTLLELGGSLDSQGGFAARAQLLGELKGTYLSAEAVHAMGGFASDRVVSGVTGSYSLSADHSFGAGRTMLPVHIEAKYTTRASGANELYVASRVSTNVGRYNVTGEIDWQKQNNPFGPDPPSIVQAALLANGRIGNVRLRGETRFRIRPDSRFDSATLVAEWSGKGDLDRSANWRAEIGYDGGLHRARLGVGYVRRFDKFALTASVEGGTDGSFAGGLNLAFSLGPDPRDGRGIRMTSERLAAHGQTLVRVFRDENGDGIRQPDEPFEKDVQVTAGRVPVDRLTDAKGETIVDELESFQPVLIGVDSSSLADPLVQPSLPGKVVTPRPGVTMIVELPLVGAGEVDGTLVREGGNGMEGVDLELVDAKGIVISHTRSDYDGYFLFESVPYGHYSLRIAKLSAEAVRAAQALGAVSAIDGKTPSVHLGTIAARASGVQTAEQ